MNNAVLALSIVVPIVGAIAAIFRMKYTAGSYSDINKEIGELRNRIVAIEIGKASSQDVIRIKEDTDKHSIDIAKLETNYNNLGERLDRMESKLDIILNEMRKS